MIEVALVTSTRAEYGLMRPLIFALNQDRDIELSLIVTGTHLVNSYGHTIDEIIEDGVPIRDSIHIFYDDEEDVSVIISRTIERFAVYFSNNKFDILIVDGDRYEMFAVCVAAVLNHLPIAHCGGGETTEGANDEYWRHCMTKMSYLHFTIMEEYRNRVIQMGENPNRVYNVGSLGLENIKNMTYESKLNVSNRVGLSLDKPYALVTYHPVTLELNSVHEVEELLSALECIQDMQFIITKSNADKDGIVINNLLDAFAKKNPSRVVCVSSLGSVYYLSAMKYADMVIGNSSSGIIETPAFRIPTINIGDRQKGRVQAKSIINCLPNKSDIIRAIEIAKSNEFRSICHNVVNPNGDGNASMRIIREIKKATLCGIDMKKSFYMMRKEDLPNV